MNDDDQITNTNGELNLVQTPMEPYSLSLNPSYDEAPRNPLCPVCEEQIRPISNGTERRFVCECDQVWKFTFDQDVEDNGGGWVTKKNGNCPNCGLLGAHDPTQDDFFEYQCSNQNCRVSIYYVGKDDG